jgi:hypothetical protein
MNGYKILIVSRSFHPSINPRAFRATELAKELARQNHNITVITHSRGNNFEKFEEANNLQILDFAGNSWKDIYMKGNVIEKKFRKLFRSILKYLFLFPDIQISFILKRYLENLQGYDILISIAAPYPVHWGVGLALKRNHSLTRTWIADCGDPFWKNKERKFGMPFYFKYVENWFCGKPDFITVPTEEAINAYPPKCRSKIHVIPQGFEYDGLRLSKEVVKNVIPTFAYAGALKKGVRDPSNLLDLLCSVKIEFRFIIYTRNKELIIPYKNFLGQKLEIRDYIPRNELLRELRKMDFLVNIENKGKFQSPSKLIDYALVEKPILSFNNNSFDKDIVLDFLDGDYTKSYQIENIEQYNIKNVAKRFIQLCS